MNVHVYKGAVHKSVIFDLMVNRGHMIGVIYNSKDRPTPNCISNVYIMSREEVDIEEFVDICIPKLLLEDTDKWGEILVIYTNHTEKENNHLIQKLKEKDGINTIIVMCKE